MSLNIIRRPVKYLYSDNSSFTNNKYIYDGADDYAVYNNVDFNGGNLTVSITVNLSDKDNRFIYLWDNGTLAYNLALWFNGANLFVSDSSLSGIVSTGGINLDEDVNITLTINNGICNCYINGVITAESPISLNIPEFDPAANNVTIGSGFAQTMEGVWDQFIVYNRVLSSNEIQALYNNGNPVNTDYIRTTQGFVFLALNRELEEAYGDYNTLTINGNPDLVNYSSDNFFLSSDVLSTWNAIGGNLPVRYKFQSDLFPLNTADTTFTVSSVDNFFGLAKVTTSASSSYIVDNYVTLKNMSDDRYNGIYQIDQTISATEFVIKTAYVGGSTGEAIRYYNNYSAVVKVYGGLPDYHVLSGDRPMVEIGELKVSPDVNNEVDVDITGLVNSAIKNDNDLFTGYAPLDFNAFTAFYIEYAEQYQDNDGSGLRVFTDTFQRDDLSGCTEDQELFTNPDFSAGLTGWSQTGGGQIWSTIGSDVEANRPDPATDRSRTLSQDIVMNKGVTYTITVNVPNDNNTEIRIFATAFMVSKIITNELTKGTNTIEFTPDKDYTRLNLIGIYQETGAAFDGQLRIAEFSIKAGDCTTYLWGSNSVQQFKYFLGGNMGEHVCIPNNDAKFLTDFSEMVYFRGKKFTVSSIIDNDSFTESYLGDSVFFRLSSGGVSVDRKIKNMNDGVYMIGNTVVEDTFEEMVLELEAATGGFTKGTIEIYSVPDNYFLSANEGNHNTTVDQAGNPPSDWGITITPAVVDGDRLIGTSYGYVDANSGNFPFEGFGMAIFQFATGFSDNSGLNKICDFTDAVTLQGNTEYTVSFWFSDQPTTGHDARLDGVAEVQILPDNYTSYSTTSVKVPVDGDETWYKQTTTFTTDTSGTYTFSLYLDLKDGLAGGTGGAFGIDQIEVLGPFLPLTEQKPFCLDDNCANQEIYLTWLNSLGGREYWNFTAIKEYKTRNRSVEIQRDIFNNWDVDFIEGDTQGDVASIDSADSITVRSQLLTKEQADAIWKIKDSLRVQQVRDDDSLITVLVDKGSFTKYEDRDRLYVVEFEITYPNNQIQTQ